jgi:hypothetical protein
MRCCITNTVNRGGLARAVIVVACPASAASLDDFEER